MPTKDPIKAKAVKAAYHQRVIKPQRHAATRLKTNNPLYVPRPAYAKLDPEEKRRRERARCLAFHYANKEKLNARSRDYYKANKDDAGKKQKAYTAKNRAKVTAQKRAYQRMRVVTDPAFHLVRNLRQRVRFAVKNGGARKSATTMELIGCSVEFLRGHLEAQFEIGMTWANMGEWHIDHKIPCVAFNMLDPRQQRECFNYSNLQPLWGVDNLKKSDTMPNGLKARFLNSKQ